MTVIGLDDTDSRDHGLCTTYVAAQVAADLQNRGAGVERRLLVRCNPAVPYKTRGNAALAVHTDAEPGVARAVLAEHLADARTADPETNPGGVVTDCDPEAVPDAVADWARRAVCDLLDREDAAALATEAGFETVTAGNGRGLVGALAAAGAWRAFDDWTCECISYREEGRWGTEREVDRESVFAAADEGYPAVWDTVDRVEERAVCVPRTPCPILHAIRGDDPRAVREVAESIDGEQVADRALFVTNQGTDAHLREGESIPDVESGRSYRLTADVTADPETREGGHVFFAVGENGDGDGGDCDDGDGGDSDDGGDGGELDCVAFEPTKRFRDRVRKLRTGDRVTVCGEMADGTLKLEKFALREAVETVETTPDCPDCGRSMASAGREQGYRCRDCGTSADETIERSIEREIEGGWYEAPPCARRHVAKPLIRGGFDGPTHPER